MGERDRGSTVLRKQDNSTEKTRPRSQNKCTTKQRPTCNTDMIKGIHVQYENMRSNAIILTNYDSLTKKRVLQSKHGERSIKMNLRKAYKYYKIHVYN